MGARMQAKKAVLRIPSLLDYDQCKALCNAVDARMTRNCDTVDGAPDFQLNVEQHGVPNAIRLVQAHVRQKLRHAAWRLLQLQMKMTGGDGEGGQEEASLISSKDMDIMASISSHPPRMFVRRYSADTRPFIPFHCDSARVTVNVALNDDRDFEGGELLALYGQRIRDIKARTAGEATVHASSLLHAVREMTYGVRYSLIVFYE